MRNNKSPIFSVIALSLTLLFCSCANNAGGANPADRAGNSSSAETAPVNASQQANLKGMQISVDSTGRANDLFRRVEVRLEGSSSHAMSIMGPLELFDSGVGNSNDTKTLFEKDYEVTQEWTF